ncbi:MAG: hypothetical protein NXI10_05415 [bacterium]|nr:hypothetical protein [bacterium]
MKITKENYFDQYNKLDQSNIPATLSKGFKLIEGASANNWAEYNANENIKRVVDMYFKTLGDYIKSQPKKESKPTRSKTASQAELHEVVFISIRNKDKGFSPDKIFFTGKEAYKNAEKWAKTYLPTFDPDFLNYSSKEELNEHKNKEQAEGREFILNPKGDISKKAKSAQRPRKKANGSKETNAKRNNSTRKSRQTIEVNPKADKVEVISDELKFIRRYVNMHDKPKTRNQIRLFVNALQRSIRERRIRKTSPYAKDILLVQDELIKLHAQFDNDSQQIAPDISEKTRVKFLKVLGKEIELMSVKLIKSYIGIQGRIVENVKASRLLTRIESAITKKKITKRDPYWSEIEQIVSNLKTFVKKNPNHGVLEIEERTLNGLQGIVDCNCASSEIISGLPEKLDIQQITQDYQSDKSAADDRFLMNSMDFSKVKFQTVGLKGKWRDFIGDPEIGFRAMTFGQPKMGKSYLMIEFAGYLASNHGTVLYAAKEEGKSKTLKMKLHDTKSKHPNMSVSNYLPANLGDYDYVFLDSVTRFGLTPDQLAALNAKYPNTAFIEIHQVTKDGKARGTNEYVHDVDIVIEVTDLGQATQNGRFNQGGAMFFFDENAVA